MYAIRLQWHMSHKLLSYFSKLLREDVDHLKQTLKYKVSLWLWFIQLFNFFQDLKNGYFIV